jgi:hypothetical protein
MKNKWIIWVVLGLLVVAGAAVASYFVFFKKGPSDGVPQEAGAPYTPMAVPQDDNGKQDEPIVYFSMWSWQDERQTPEAWSTYLDHVKEWGGNTIITDIPWFAAEPKEGDFSGLATLDPFVQSAVDHDLNMILVLDAGVLRGDDHREPTHQPTPDWVFKKFPDAKVQDFDGFNYPILSFAHDEAFKLNYKFLSEAVKYYKGKFGDTMLAFNPNYNNQQETRYSQQGFRWTDYNDVTIGAYQDWLKDEYGSVSKLNQLWGSFYGSFEEIQPLRVDTNQSGFDPDIRPSFTDWMRFREANLQKAISGSADAIHGAGGKVFLHFGEVLTKIDAIFTIPVELLADVADILTVDINHLTADAQESDPSIVGLSVSHARGNGAAVIFEDSIESLADGSYHKRRDAIVQESIRWAMANGSAGIGVANFVFPWEQQGLFTFQRKIRETMQERKEFSHKAVAMYASKWLPYTMHTTNDYRNEDGIYDPWQANVTGMFKMLEDAGVPVAVLSDEAIKKGKLKDYDVLFLPYQLAVPEDTLKEINSWHDGGGALVQDMRFAEFSLTGQRGEQKLLDRFGVSSPNIGTDLKATVSDELAKVIGAKEMVIGDGQLEYNSTAGLFTTTWVGAQQGTTSHLNRVGNSGVKTLAINKDKRTAYLGFLPGLLYNQRKEKEVLEPLRETLLFVLQELRKGEAE